MRPEEVVTRRVRVRAPVRHVHWVKEVMSRLALARINLDGSLLFGFTDGVNVRVPCGPDYEAWDAWAENGPKFTGLAGGGYGEWGRSHVTSLRNDVE